MGNGIHVLLSDADVARVAEYFDGDMDDLKQFLSCVWLPDAVTTLHKIIREASRSPKSRIAYLCDHLREGARTVGARPIMDAADQMQVATELEERARVLAIAHRSIPSLCLISSLLTAA
jgi:hypothetical protein